MIGTITPAMLVRLLRPYGYEVTLRCLTDWRYKGYLPALMRTSRGYRKGVLRHWSESDILQKALTLCRRLKERGTKRVIGPIHKNWLSGAVLPISRVRKSWLNTTASKSHVPKLALQKCATKLGAEISMPSGYVIDILYELQRVIFRPKYRAGMTLDIDHIHKVVQRIWKGFFGAESAALMTEEMLAELLGYLNLYFSPAAAQVLIASATDAELLGARDKWICFWRRMDGIWQGLFVRKGCESSLMPLAGLLAPIGVILLLPSEYKKPALNGAQPV